MNIEILLSFFIAAVALTFAPGPDIVYVLTQSIANGKNSGIATATGLVSGIIIHTSLVAFGVSVLIRENDTLFFVIKLFGALYLFYIAYQVFKSPEQIALENNQVPKKTGWQLVKQGFIMNVLNPKVTIFFLAFFPGFLFSTTLSKVTQFYILGGIFMLQAFVIFCGVSFLAGTISKVLHKKNNIGFIFKWVQILVFIVIGFYILLSEK
ncbi:LysE family translocator [Zhouia sp. PK063]|uniref:LysE family translocator n=1 Tax=Zhouia sp. PK063 TaxID=3373602 RepID=UPI0037AA091F